MKRIYTSAALAASALTLLVVSGCAAIGPGFETTTITFMIYQQALQAYDIGAASAGALFAVLLANIAAFFLMRFIGKNLVK